MKSSIVHRTVGLNLAVPVLATLIILPTSTARAQSVTLQAGIQQTNGPQITLTVNGSLGQPYMLQMTTNLTDWSFLTEGVAPYPMDLSNVDSTWTNRPAAFFRATSNDPSDASLEGSDYLAPPQCYIYLSNAPVPLVTEVAFDLGVCIADTNGNTVQVSGWAAFSLQGPDYQPVPFSYAFVPLGLNISNGIGQVRVTLSTTGDLSTARIQLIPGVARGIHPLDSPSLTSLLSSPATFQASIPSEVFAVLADPGIVNRPAAFYAKLLQLRTNYTSSASSWTYPLPSAAQPSDGFGSHRQGLNNTPYPPVGRLHSGVDLLAPYGTSILAAMSGMIISWHHLGHTSSSAGGDQVLVDHGNGTWTRYLHVALNANKRIYDPVTAGEAFATVGITSGSHLHFEICRDPSITDAVVANNPDRYFGAISRPPAALINAVDLRFGAGAADRLFPVASVAPPAITNMIITDQQPWLQNVPFAKSAPWATPAGPRYVLAQVVDWKGGYTLPPRGILFESDSNATVSLVFDRYLPGNPTTVAHYLPYLHQTGDSSGLARYPSPQDAQVTAQNKPKWYRYWFAWDPSAYSLTNAGPRSFRITATNNYGTTASQQFTFGPQVEGSLIVSGPLGGQQFIFTNVAYLGTNLLADPSQPDPNFSQPDQYKLQIIQPNGQPLPGVTWSGPMAGSDLTKVFTVHRDEAVYTFTLPTGLSTDGLRLRVSSLLVTNIAHEVCFCSAATNMVFIPAGTFVMGSPTSEAERFTGESQHTVTLTKGFCMGKYMVTQGEYLALMGSNPSTCSPAHGWSPDLNRPVDSVPWVDATNYCTHLTQRDQTMGRLPSGWVYRLPTEAEWEYACRAGTTTAFNFGSAIHGGMANFYCFYEYDASIGTIYVPNQPVPWSGCTTPVGSYQPNAWGLYDMHGNMWEWCWDWYWSYPAGSVTDPQGPTSGSFHVSRGGSCSYRGKGCRSAVRGPDYIPSGAGFRLVLAPAQP